MAEPDSLLADALQAINDSGDEKSLESLRVQYLGKKGSLTALLKNLGQLAPEDRPAAGGVRRRRGRDRPGEAAARAVHEPGRYGNVATRARIPAATPEREGRGAPGGAAALEIRPDPRPGGGPRRHAGPRRRAGPRSSPPVARNGRRSNPRPSIDSGESCRSSDTLSSTARPR